MLCARVLFEPGWIKSARVDLLHVEGLLVETGHNDFWFEDIGVIAAFRHSFIRAAFEKRLTFDLAERVYQDT